MKKNKKKKLKYKIPLIILAILIIFIVIMLIFKIFGGKKEDTTVKVVDSIDNFGYTLDERDTKLMKDTYNELKKCLQNKDVDYDEYAKILAKLFIIDLYTINNKVNKYDVGSLEYVYPDNIDNFKLNVEDTLYKIVENNTDNKRKQSLPEVSSITVDDVKKDKFSYGEDEHDSYIVKANWQYAKDLGYDDSATVTLIQKDNRLYVVAFTPGEENE